MEFYGLPHSSSVLDASRDDENLKGSGQVRIGEAGLSKSPKFGHPPFISTPSKRARAVQMKK